MTNRNKKENAEIPINLSGISTSTNNGQSNHTVICISTLARDSNIQDGQYSVTRPSVCPRLSPECVRSLEPQPGTSSDGRIELESQTGTSSDGRIDLELQPGTSSDGRIDLELQPGTSSDGRIEVGPEPGTSSDGRIELEPQPGTSSDGIMECNPVYDGLYRRTKGPGITKRPWRILNIEGTVLTTHNTVYNQKPKRGVKRKRDINPTDEHPRKRRKLCTRLLVQESNSNTESNPQRLLKPCGLKRRCPPSLTNDDLEPVTKKLKLYLTSVITAKVWYAKLKTTNPKQGNTNHVISERKRQAPITFFQVHSEPVIKKLKLSGKKISKKERASRKCPECCPCKSSDNLLSIAPIPREFQVREPLLNKLLKLRSLRPCNILKQCVCKQRCDVGWFKKFNKSMGKHLRKSVIEEYWHSDLSIYNYKWGPWKN